MSLYQGEARLARVLEPEPKARVRPWGMLGWLVVGLLAALAALDALPIR